MVMAGNAAPPARRRWLADGHRDAVTLLEFFPGRSDEMNVRSYVSVIVASFALWLAAPLFAGAASRVTPASPAVPPPLAKVAGKAPVKPKKRTTRRRYYTMEPTFADSTAGDYTEGEDPAVRQAAIRALGKYNGSVVVVDTSDGRVLTMVNQKLALSNGYVPCSTIKLVAGLAALKEGLVDRVEAARPAGATRPAPAERAEPAAGAAPAPPTPCA